VPVKWCRFEQYREKLLFRSFYSIDSFLVTFDKAGIKR